MALISIGRKSEKAKEREAAEAKAAALASLEVKSDEVHVTEDAAEQIKERLRDEGHPEGYLRVSIRGGGCSGLTYHFDIEAEAKAKDHIFEAYGAKVCVDPKSLKLLGGTVLDYDKALGSSGFAMKNPHARGACSCGQSFSI